MLLFSFLSQSIRRNIQKAGLAKLYGKNCDFAFGMRHLSALAFLPEAEIPLAFKEIVDKVLPPEAHQVIQWCKNYYIGTDVYKTKK